MSTAAPSPLAAHIDKLLKVALDNQATELRLSGGKPPMLRINDKLRERRRSDPMLRLKDAIRGSIRAYLGSKKTRRGSTFEIVGCTPDFLRGHLEKQFKDGMTWENYGPYWHVDHRIPLASGNSPEEIMGLSHWTNLQPLTAFENISKGAKIPVAGCQ